MAEPATLSPSTYGGDLTAAWPPLEADAALPELPSNPYAPLTITHTVEAGETLSEIASRYQVPIRRLIDSNPALGDHPDLLARSATLVISVADVESLPHEVSLAPGQSLTDLATRHDLSLGQLWQANRHSLRDGVGPGETLWIPSIGPAAKPAPMPQAAPVVEPLTEPVPEPTPDTQASTRTLALEEPAPLKLQAPKLLADTAAPPAPAEPASATPTPARSPGITTSLTLADHATESASAGLLRLDIKGPLGDSGSFKLSAGQLVKLPDEGASTAISRLSADLYKTLYQGSSGSVQAGMGLTAWTYVNLQDGGPGKPQGYDKTLVFNSADVSGTYKVGAGLDVHGKAGAWTALDPENKTRTLAPYAQGGVGLGLNGLQINDDVRAEFQLKHELPDAQYVYNVLDLSLKISDNVSANARWTRMLQGEAKAAPPDLPQGEKHEDKFSGGMTVTF